MQWTWTLFTLFAFLSDFISNDEILFPFERFRCYKAKKMFRRSTTITHYYYHQINTMRLFCIWDWHKIDWNKTELLRIVAGRTSWAHTSNECDVAVHRGCTMCRPPHTGEILCNVCMNYLWLVVAASLHVRLFDAGSETDQWNNNNTLHLCR